MFKSKYIAKIMAKLRIPSFDGCKIDRTCNVNYESVLSKVEMDKYSYVGARTTISNAKIGGFCSIGNKCSIGGGMHPLETVSTSPVFLNGINFLHTNFADIPYSPSKLVVIGNDVWVGDSVYIKSGVSIGTGAVIGAHAVVTKDVAPYAIVAGVPAKEIRKRFDDETIEQLLKLEWWNWSEEKLRKMGSYFITPEKLISEIEGRDNES